MRFGPIECKDKNGRAIILRNAETTDADDLIKYLKITAGETPFLLREPEEVTVTIEQEENFIKDSIEAERELMLLATLNGEHIGNCSLRSLAPYKRYAHRCEVSIALYRKFCGVGIGEIMLRTILDIAKQIGYEQAELEVISDNAAAIALYKKLGFKKQGHFPNNMKYKCGKYADADWMIKML